MSVCLSVCHVNEVEEPFAVSPACSVNYRIDFVLSTFSLSTEFFFQGCIQGVKTWVLFRVCHKEYRDLL